MKPVGISAGAIIYDNNGKVLIAKRAAKREWSPGLWETVGGRMEYGEAPEEAMRREIMEEIGCEVTDVKLFNVYNFVAEDHQRLFIVFKAKINTAPTPDPEEIEEVKWITEDEIDAHEFCINCKERLLDFYKQD